MSIFDLFDFTKNLVAQMGYFGVFIGTFLESIFPPIPSEVILGFSGFLIADGKFSPIPTLIAAVAGNALSVSLIWLLGKKFGKPFLIRYGKYIGVSQNDILKGENLFNKHGYKMVFFCQMVPLARTLIAFPAGTLKTKYSAFIFANSLGATIWFSILLGLGYVFGENWDQVETFLKPFEYLILGTFAAIFLYLVYRFFVSKKSENLPNS